MPESPAPGQALHPHLERRELQERCDADLGQTQQLVDDTGGLGHLGVVMLLEGLGARGLSPPLRGQSRGQRPGFPQESRVTGWGPWGCGETGGAPCIRGQGQWLEGAAWVPSPAAPTGSSPGLGSWLGPPRQGHRGQSPTLGTRGVVCRPSARRPLTGVTVTAHSPGPLGRCTRTRQAGCLRSRLHMKGRTMSRASGGAVRARRDRRLAKAATR